ncbi:hypothetical protein [Streptomyces sp. NPDC096033]|uniref:hypothetical protein n=1 Tax=Streptomyces sp. NPDC096033 TaxID=3366071 RepID=UPI00382F0FB6
MEINALARLLRGWVDEAQLGVDGVRGQFTAEHFAAGAVPSRATVASRLSGTALRWDFVEAVIDVCSSHAQVAERRRVEARKLWEAAQRNPTALPVTANRAGVENDQELSKAQDRIVRLRIDLAVAQEARDSSRKALADTTNLISVLWLIIGQLQFRIDQLTRHRDSLQTNPGHDGTQLDELRTALARAQRRRSAAEQEKAAAEESRAEAREVAAAADHAYFVLVMENDALNGEPGQHQPTYTSVPADDAADVFITDIDNALVRARSVREQASELTHSARTELASIDEPVARASAIHGRRLALTAQKQETSSDPDNSPNSQNDLDNPRTAATDAPRHRRGSRTLRPLPNDVPQDQPNAHRAAPSKPDSDSGPITPRAPGRWKWTAGLGLAGIALITVALVQGLPDWLGSSNDGRNGADATPPATTSSTPPATPSVTPSASTPLTETEHFSVEVPTSWTRRGINDRGQVIFDGEGLQLTVVPGREKVVGEGDPAAYQKDNEPELEAYRRSGWAAASNIHTVTLGPNRGVEGTFAWYDEGRDVYARNCVIMLNRGYHVLLVTGPKESRALIDTVADRAKATYKLTP